MKNKPMKKNMIIFAATFMLASCVKQNWKCHCTVTDKATTGNQTTTTTYTSTIDVHHTTKQKAQQFQCADTDETNTYQYKSDEVTKSCVIN